MSMSKTESVLSRKQTKTFGPRPIAGWGSNATITAEVSYDDDCNNGHNTFTITGEINLPNRRDCEACGMLHDEIRKCFPELVPFLKWHLVSSDASMHYVANTLYWLGYSGWCDGKPNSPPKIDYARSCAVWEDLPEEMLASSGKYTKEQVEQALRDRQADLMQHFRKAVEFLGFTY